MSDIDNFWDDEKTRLYEDAEEQARLDLIGSIFMLDGRKVRIKSAAVLVEELDWEPADV